jgi:hypothetical protein
MLGGITAYLWIIPIIPFIKIGRTTTLLQLMLKKPYKAFDSVIEHFWNTQLNLGIIMVYLVNK